MKKRLAIVSVILLAILILPTGAFAKSSAKDAAVPQKIVDLLAEGELKKAIFEMRELPPCPKKNYLMHSANRIVLFEMEKKPSRSTAHEVYQNVAIAYHNLYLFLKARGITRDDYYDNADRYYSKGRRTGTHLHKADCDILRAALIASGGDVEKARKNFQKIDELMLRGDFESMGYIAVYYAAVGDHDEALHFLETAFSMDPKRTLKWLDVSDDFHELDDDPRFIAMKDSWRAKSKNRDLVLKVPGCEEPRLNMTGADPYSPIGFSRKAKRQLKANRNKK
jgi:tetratricopeptide (TPR) repeat protein